MDNIKENNLEDVKNLVPSSSNRKTGKTKKIVEVFLIFFIIDYIAGILIKNSNVFLYLLLPAILMAYGLYLVKRKDFYALKVYFYLIILSGLLKILSIFLRNI
jgi:hypothetical protein